MLTERLKSRGYELGFAHVGVAPAVTPTGFHRLLQWIDQGQSADMQWIERRRDAYRHPDGVMPGTRSVIMAAMNYHDGTEPRSGARIARYAAGVEDYHDVLKPRLKQLAQVLRAEIPTARTRVVVDTAPLLERDFGRLAGIGWFGKNTMLISRSIGSWFFLGALLTDVELDYDTPFEHDYCGTCTRCLDACPTDAFPEPGVLDARRCISYLTIEHRQDPIPAELRSGIQDWLFGCDICQEVCPWNRFAPEETLPEFQQTPSMNIANCRELLRLTEEQFHSRFGQTPLARPGRAGLLRNAAIVAGNLRLQEAESELIGSLNDSHPLIRGAAAWALGQLATPTSLAAVKERLTIEADPFVCEELRAARLLCQICKEGWLGSNDSEPPAAGGYASLRPQPPNPSPEP
jgi:epoxyqueuosine reductase